MTLATVFLADEAAMIRFYTEDQTAVARDLMRRDAYRELGQLVAPGKTGEAAAEECFDLSNNPSRQAERDAVWGANRSLSVGDVVLVEGDMWLCRSMGWQRL
jgi:hypothetical protein